jgi:hypothetical protein
VKAAGKAHAELAAVAPARAREPGSRWIDQFSQRDDSDPIQGHFVDVIAGEHEGRYGTFEEVATADPETGVPSTIVVRTRDDQHERLVVEYEDAVPARAGGRR